MPVVVELLPVDGENFAGARPEIVVDGFRGRDGCSELADGLAGLVAEATGEGELAEVTFLHPVKDVVPSLLGAALESVGNHDAVVGLSKGEFFAFPDIVGDGLFDVDVLSLSGGAKGDEGMSVVTGGDANGVDFGILADLAVVGVGLETGEFTPFFELFLFAVELVGVDIAEAHESRFFMRKDATNVRAAPAFDSDYDDAEFTIGTGGAGMGSQEGKGACVDRGAEEIAAIHYFEKFVKLVLRESALKLPC